MGDTQKHTKPNVPNLRFPGFEGEWEQHLLSEYLDFKNGLNPSAKSFGEGIKFISVMDILNNPFITYDCIRASVNATEKEKQEFNVEYGDILFQRSSETLEDVGHANVYLDSRTALFGGFTIRGKKKGVYNPLFFKYLLDSPTARKKVIVKGAGAQHFNIGQEGLSKVVLSFPSIQEQNRIAVFMNLLDQRIAIQNKVIEDLKKLKTALCEQLYNEHNPNSYIGDLIKQKSIRNRMGEDLKVLSVSNRYGFIEQSEQFEDRTVASEDTSNYKIVSLNDFAYNPARINVGSIARLKFFEKGIVSPMYICFHCKENVLPEFLEHFLNTKYFSLEMEKRLEGSVRMCLSFEGLCNIPIYIPSYEMQMDIGKKITVLNDKLGLEESYSNYLNSHKRYLLSQLFI